MYYYVVSVKTLVTAGKSDEGQNGILNIKKQLAFLAGHLVNKNIKKNHTSNDRIQNVSNKLIPVTILNKNSISTTIVYLRMYFGDLRLY